jgi:hypothetical protein
MYNPDALRKGELPKAGDKIAATVKNCFEGKLSQFISEEHLKKWPNAEPGQLALKVVVTLANGIELSKVLGLPSTNEVHPKSNLQKWADMYGDYPREGQEIYLIADAQGMYLFQA